MFRQKNNISVFGEIFSQKTDNVSAIISETGFVVSGAFAIKGYDEWFHNFYYTCFSPQKYSYLRFILNLQQKNSAIMPKILSTTLCSAMHFLVDCLCLCALYLASGGANNDNIISIFMTYNILAFATQPFTGIIADKIGKKHWLSFIS